MRRSWGGVGRVIPGVVKDGQFQGEGGAAAGAVAMGAEGAAHFAGGQGAAVQAEAVTILPGGEAVGKDAGEILRRDADAVVDDGNSAPVVGGQECGQVAPVVPQPIRRPGQAGDPGFFEDVGDEGGGDVDAVEDVAHVVEDSGGDLGHARVAGGCQELFVDLFQFGLRPLALGDVPEIDHQADCAAGDPLGLDVALNS